ncbi:MAG: hypothetical protein J0I36_00250, partial [Pandoraea sp.]|nr:hypothetical protein [Pandoraea sp.]
MRRQCLSAESIIVNIETIVWIVALQHGDRARRTAICGRVTSVLMGGTTGGKSRKFFWMPCTPH